MHSTSILVRTYPVHFILPQLCLVGVASSYGGDVEMSAQPRK